MRAIPTNLAEAAAFMRAAKYVPLRYDSPEIFLMSAAGDDVITLEAGDTKILFVLRHDANEKTTFMRAAVKQGPGDAMALAFQAVKQGTLFAFPTVVTDVPVERLQSKLLNFTQGATLNGVATVVWRTDLTPMEASDV
jgi:hypothetical protein